MKGKLLSLLGGAALAALLSAPAAHAGSVLPMLFNGGNAPSSGGGGGSVPAAANAGCLTANGGGPSNGSCFNTLVVNLDFTGATSSFIGTGATFDASQPISDWLTGCGGSLSTIGIGTWAGMGSPVCSDFSIVTDGSTKALRIGLTSTDVTNGVLAMNMATTDGYVFSTPISFYYQVTMRNDSTTLANSSAGNDLISAYSGHTIGWLDPILGEASTFVEEDLDERFSGSPANEGVANVVEWNGSQGDACYAANCGGQIANLSNGQSLTGVGTLDFTQYTTYGMRVTSDTSGNIEYCGYVNGVSQGCQYNVLTAGSFDASGYYDRNGGFGLQGPSCQNGCTAPLYGYFVSEQVWSCSAWNTNWSDPTNSNPGNSSGNPCAGALITSTP